jgi:haloalkane dehalogenase
MTYGIDRALYPFESHYLEVTGGRMHYVDEGSGPVLVLVHGTPTWSFLYRHLIRDLSRTHRVVALDHPGFGLSDKPRGGDYRPKSLARNVDTLVERLGLEEIVLVVHDFGGPIGLSHALDHPANVRGLVLFNTWLWSLAGTPAEKASRLLGGRLGRFLYTWLNFSPRVLLPSLFGDRRKLDKAVHRQYLAPFPTRSDRYAPAAFARELMASADWYESLWNRRSTLAHIPALLLWGMKDSAFGPEALERWKLALPHARVVEFAEAGHFVQEEAPDEATAHVREFLSELPPIAGRREARQTGHAG